ncbi:ABC transporter substrate-binding protein [Cupriavidus sp. SK-3]|uniref:DUF2076 domain-containing protein n=1 Tax=Cupriavidus sp. SK-3 TaxID=1470558 RepID=UPI0004516F41|nr:DUF2076 family protein [Cupriavidus sp. SK-3]KDP83218.1 ABC transporter substrate-binding protein [Cupriavidus sp. SK-3]
MTPQEMQALEAFLTQLTQARAGMKDPQADALIAEAAARQPDAAYLLVQRAMMLDQALASAKAQIATLQSQLQMAQASGANRFLDADNAWGNSAGRVAASPAAPQAAAAPVSVPPAAPQAAPAQPPRPGFLSGGLGSTLGGIATTAAGVAGGALLFQGIENLFHRNSAGGGASGFLGQPAAGALPSETTVVNNYYGNEDRSPLGEPGAALDNGLLDDGLGNDDFTDDDSFNV